MSQFEHNGIRLYYETCGSGSPLLLINGLSCDTRSWEMLIPHIKDNYNVITYDMRCAGKSDKPAAACSIHDLAEEAFALIEHLGFKKLRIAGFSMGGMVAMDLALSHSDMVEGLFLISTAPSFTRPYPQEAHVREMLQRTDVSDELLTSVFETVFGSEYRKMVTAEDYIKFRMEDPFPQPVESYLRQLAAIDSFDMVDRVAEISCPVHIVTGDEDRIINPENARWLADRISGAKLHVLKGVGHMVPIEAPGELAKIMSAVRT